MARSRFTLLIVVALLLSFLAGVGFLISGGPKVVVRPLLPYESQPSLCSGYLYLHLGNKHRVADFMGHVFPVEGVGAAPYPRWYERRIFLVVSKSVPISELWEVLGILRREAEQNTCRTTIVFTYD